MRFFLSSLLILFGLCIVGCGGDSGPQTTDLSEIESFVEDNADDMARQEALEAAREAEEEAEEAEDD